MPRLRREENNPLFRDELLKDQDNIFVVPIPDHDTTPPPYNADQTPRKPNQIPFSRHSPSAEQIQPMSTSTSKLKARRQSARSAWPSDEKWSNRHIFEAENLSNYKKFDDFEDEDDDEFDTPDCESVCMSYFDSVRFRWLLAVALTVLIGLCFMLMLVLIPWWEEHSAISTSLSRGPPMNLNAHMAPSFAHITLLRDLDTVYLPVVGDGKDKHKHGKQGRLIVVGDVHGMKSSLLKLLKKVKFDKERDHLVLAGDMINKGPESAGVIELAMELGATGVRGNHEDRVLLAHQQAQSIHVEVMSPHHSDALKSANEGKEKEHSHSQEFKALEVAKTFTRTQLKWLQDCPVILRVGDLPGMGEVVVVHGGLVPWLKLKRQDPWWVMNMRSIDLDTWVPSDGRDGVNWSKLWNRYQAKLPKNQRSTVVYGHDSPLGLQKRKYSKGLDTNCVRGGRLTALVIEGGAKEVKQKITSVKCHME